MKLPLLLLSLTCLTAPLFAQSASTLAVDEAQSRVSVSVHATMDSFVGKLEKYALSIQLDPAGRITSAEFRFDFADLHTGKAERDKEMLKWLNAAQFPDGEFRLAQLQVTQADRYLARGSLKLHGVEHSVEFPVAVLHEGGTYSIDGEAPIDCREYGLPIIRKFAVLRVDPVVKIQFHIQGGLKG